MFLFSRTGPYLDDVDPSIQLESAAGEDRVAQWRTLRAFVARTRPQVVVSFLSYFSVLTAVRAAAVGARVVFNQQTPMSAFLADGDYPWRAAGGGGVQRGDAPGYAAADLLVTTSQGVADDLVTAFGVRRDHIAVVAESVASTRFERRARNRSTAFERAGRRR